ncbi:MAG: antitoxin [Thermoprotei archaeon]|nr:MAG: antitoxin [Thermoprotei archaeon]
MVRIAERIIIDPQICFGKPVIEGTRIPVHMVLELLGEGLTPQEIMEKCYPQLTEEDILICIRYANSLVKNEEIYVA